MSFLCEYLFTILSASSWLEEFLQYAKSGTSTSESSPLRDTVTSVNGFYFLHPDKLMRISAIKETSLSQL